MATYIVGGVVIILLALAFYKVFKNRKKTGCGCGCAGCSERENCHSRK